MAQNSGENKIDKNTLGARLAHTTSEIRYVKEQQFRTTYYALLIFSAIIALFQINVEIPFAVYRILKIIIIAIVAVLFRQTSQIQWDHFKALGEYRIGLEEIENQLMQERDSLSNKTLKNRIPDWILTIVFGKELPRAKKVVTAQDKIPYSKRYTWLLISITFLAGAATAVVVCFDA